MDKEQKELCAHYDVYLAILNELNAIHSQFSAIAPAQPVPASNAEAVSPSESAVTDHAVSPTRRAWRFPPRLRMTLLLLSMP